MIALLQLSTTIRHRKSSVKENVRTEKILLQEKGELSEIEIILKMIKMSCFRTFY